MARWRSANTTWMTHPLRPSMTHTTATPLRFFMQRRPGDELENLVNLSALPLWDCEKRRANEVEHVRLRTRHVYSVSGGNPEPNERPDAHRRSGRVVENPLIMGIGRRCMVSRCRREGIQTRSSLYIPLHAAIFDIGFIVCILTLALPERVSFVFGHHRCLVFLLGVVYQYIAGMWGDTKAQLR